MKLLLAIAFFSATGCQQATPNWALVSALIGPTISGEDCDPDKPLAKEYKPNKANER